MKANDLMLGDWIYSREEDECGQVCELREDFVEINVELPKEGQACWIDGKSKNFEGIPLTKEIIRSNTTFFESKYRKEYNPIPFWEDGDRFYCGCEGGYEFEVRYVHELQNFLRVIGCSDIADDFKIK